VASGKHTRELCVALRKPLRPPRLNVKSPKVQQTFTSEDAEDFAKARRGLREQRLSLRYLPVQTRWDALREGKISV